MWMFQEGSVLAEGASVPALGLSNKAVFNVDEKSSNADRKLATNCNDQYSETYFTPQSLTCIWFSCSVVPFFLLIIFGTLEFINSYT